MVNVLFAGGGTAGHVAPMLAIVRDFTFQDPDGHVTILGTEDGLESRLVPQAGYELNTIEKVPFPRSVNASMVKFPGRFAHAVSRTRDLMKKNNIEVVVGVGGYVSTPAYLAAASLRVPIVIHEGNAVPGLANKLGARFTKHVGYTFASTPMKGKHVGMPMRREIAQINRKDPLTRYEAMQKLGLDPSLATVIVTGGSSGAQAINDAFCDAVPEIKRTGVQVLHITGIGKADKIREATADLRNYHVTEYVDGMETVYSAADLLICRAGAGTVAEVTVAQVPALYVPLAIGNGEQVKNASDPVTAGGALMVDNAAFSATTIKNTVIPLAKDPHRLRNMTKRLNELQFPSTADREMTRMIFEAADVPYPCRAYPYELMTRDEREDLT